MNYHYRSVIILICLIYITFLAFVVYNKFVRKEYFYDSGMSLVPLIGVGEELIDYKKTVEDHFYKSKSKSGNLFDGEYIRSKFDEYRPYIPLKQRIFYDEM